jgi:glutamate dehydrogenase (NADP+)
LVGARNWLFGQYKRIRNEFTGVLTGKGLAYGGSLDQSHRLRVVYFAEQMLNTIDQN